MQLNTLAPAEGAKSKKHRLGRGIGSTFGKTCGRGHKGQRARAGGYHKVGFEGGQMPIQRRLPKFGFTCYKSLFSAEVRTADLNALEGDVDLNALKQAGIVNKNIKSAKIYLSGELKKAINLIGVKASKGAKEMIEKAGGKVSA